jgi:hypothetical protein
MILEEVWISVEIMKYIVTCMFDYRRGMHWWIDLLTTLQVVTTDDCNTIADFQTLQFTIPYKSSPARNVFTSRSLVNSSQQWRFFSFCAHVVTVRQISQLNCQLKYSAISSQPPLQNSVLNWLSESESESELLKDWRFAVNHFVMATSPLRPTTRISSFQLNTSG